MRVLDLYCGLKGWSSAFEQRGHEVVSLDIDPKFEPTIAADIFEIEIEEIAKYGPYDAVLASPVCQGFSISRVSSNWDHPDETTYIPKSDRALESLGMLRRTLEIVDYLEPEFWVMENPRAMMRKMQEVQHLERRTVTYCQYGKPYMKPTDLFGGFDDSFVTRPPCKRGMPCHEPAPRGSHDTGVQALKNHDERSLVPYELSLEVCLYLEGK